MSLILPFTLAVAALYALSSWQLRRAPASWGVRLLVPLALAGHAALLYHAILGQGDLRLGLGSTVSLIGALTAATYLVACRGVSYARLQAWVSGLAALTVLAQAVFTADHAIPNSQTFALRAHLVVSFLAYALLAVAALHAVMMTVLEKQLHHGGTIEGGAPPLLTLEAILFRTIGAGFFLLTLAVGSGVLFSEALFGAPMQFTHKVVFALLSWLVFGGLLLGRAVRGWRGRTALYWTVTGYTLLLLAYVGTRFVLEVLLGR